MTATNLADKLSQFASHRDQHVVTVWHPAPDDFCLARHSEMPDADRAPAPKPHI